VAVATALNQSATAELIPEPIQSVRRPRWGAPIWAADAPGENTTEKHSALPLNIVMLAIVGMRGLD
jgi:hypothetical protein